jgi:RecA/RadA recombinase
MAFYIDEAEIRKAIAIFHPDGREFEVRLVEGKKWNMAGVFRDADALIAALKNPRIHPGANAYMTLNRLHEACYARDHHDKFVEYANPTVSDNDVIGYDWLLVDVDPRRPAGTSSTNEQLKGSRETAKKILEYLKGRGWNDPIIGHSGNGTHLIYKVALSTERKQLMQNALKALALLFSDDKMDIDLTTFNPSRICKLYGTVARKGANTEKWPHRLSRILKVPERIEEIAPEFLEELVRILPQEEKPQRYNSYNPGGFNLQDWIDQHGVAVKEKTSWAGGTKWILECCPFNPQHNHKDAAIIQTTDGKICFNCFHSSCADKKWREFRQFYEPDAYQGDSRPPVPNYMAEMPPGFGKMTVPTEVDKKLNLMAYGTETPPEEGPVFRTTEEIRNRVVPDEAFILTGIRGIDDRMRGLKKGYVTVLSGLRSAGKSSILSQIVIQCREQGLKCAMFSGEMNDKQVLKWLTLQAAGKAHVHGTQWERGSYPNDNAAVAISQWLDGFVYVYNNDFGTQFTEMEKHLIRIVEEKKLDFILIDNLMALNIENLDRDIYVQQKKFVNELKRMAVTLNIHILFVAHPRKNDGYLRMNDISGSGDLSNAADNVFIIHRVDEDYKKYTQQFFRWKSENPIYSAGNVIEICKDRDNGNRDVYVPLYFEVETKRLKNSVTEYVHYGWENGFNPASDDFIQVDLADEDLPW